MAIDSKPSTNPSDIQPDGPGPVVTGPTPARWWHWMLLIVCIAVQAGLFIAYAVAVALLPRMEAWLDIPARLTTGFLAATLVTAIGLVLQRPWARAMGMATPAQLVWPISVSAGGSPAEAELILGAALVIGAAAVNVGLLILIGPLFRRARMARWDVAAVGLCLVAAATALIDPGPHPPGERLQPTGIGSLLGVSSSGQVVLPDGSRLSSQEIRAIPEELKVDLLEHGSGVIYGIDASGRPWLTALEAADTYSGTGDTQCWRLGGRWRVRGPAFRIENELLIAPRFSERGDAAVGILLPVVPGNESEAEELARPRLIGSYCLDELGRVRSHDPPALFGY